MNSIPKPKVAIISLYQLGILSVAALIALLINKHHAQAVLLGGLLHIVTQAYFARLAFRYRGASQLGSMVKAFYKGETGKLILTVLGFAALWLWWKPQQPISLFVGYILMIIAYNVLAYRLLVK